MVDQIPFIKSQEIEARLAAIELAAGVRFLLAIESGSRAWGFPSPDSDFDVRFIYVRPRDAYLTLEPIRDVVEAPIDNDMDLNGWDIRKALRLMLKSNATVNEWLLSPIRYRPDHPVTERLASLANEIFDPRGVGHHYASLGRNAAEHWLDNSNIVPVKRYFYALRPALTIRALRHDSTRRPPMNLQALLEISNIPMSIRGMIDELVEAKRGTNEAGNARRSPALDALIWDELDRAGELPKRELTDRARAQADCIFLELFTG